MNLSSNFTPNVYAQRISLNLTNKTLLSTFLSKKLSASVFGINPYIYKLTYAKGNPSLDSGSAISILHSLVEDSTRTITISSIEIHCSNTVDISELINCLFYI